MEGGIETRKMRVFNHKNSKNVAGGSVRRTSTKRNGKSKKNEEGKDKLLT